MEWSPQWFNKTKFHFLNHLLDHIRRFGPAILFATEAFESFNAVIRAWCINSNRLAPSRDAATRASHLARVRHLISGGLYPVKVDHDNEQCSQSWQAAGPAALGLVTQPSIITRRLGIQDDLQPKYGVISCFMWSMMS